MKRYRNRLQRVLDVRRVQEEKAKAQVRQARAEATLADMLAAARLEQYREHDNPVGPAPYVGHRIERSLYELKGLMALEAEERRVASHRQVEIRLGVWSEAARRVEALERLDARRREEHRTEADRAESAELDDIATSRRRIEADDLDGARTDGDDPGASS